MFENITLSEVAGYGVGALLLGATISAPKIDALISSSQRSSLGMCRRCGDLKMIACSSCNGVGLIKEGGPFNLIPLNNDSNYNSFASKSKPRSSNICTKCRAKGRFECPECFEFTKN